MVQLAHLNSLMDQGVIDSAAGTAITNAITAVATESRQETQPWALVRAMDAQVEATLPPEIAGAASLGRTVSETIATAMRLQWRQSGADLAERAWAVRAALLELAQAHTVTVMGGFVDRTPAAPTTLGHFLGGAIGELESTFKRLADAIDAIDRSPMGAGLMVGEVFSADREVTTRALGFATVIENTMDASGSVEDIVALVEATAAQSAVLRRFVAELLEWIRTDPTSFFIDERWESMIEPTHPAHNVSHRLELLALACGRVERDATGATQLLRSLPYGPIGIAWDAIVPAVGGVLSGGESVLAEGTAAVREALIVNRAYLANRAGRMYSTASDLAVFLMEDQQIAPTAARKVAGLAVARLKEASLEAAQITPDIIDAAAVMVIGQDLKVEMETLGRYIAPRRYIERRDVVGSPKADRTRAWLTNVAARLERDRAAISERRARWSNLSL